MLVAYVVTRFRCRFTEDLDGFDQAEGEHAIGVEIPRPPRANDKAFLAASGMCGRRTASSFCIVDFGCFEELLWEKAGEVLGHTDVGLASQKFG